MMAAPHKGCVGVGNPIKWKRRSLLQHVPCGWQSLARLLEITFWTWQCECFACWCHFCVGKSKGQWKGEAEAGVLQPGATCWLCEEPHDCLQASQTEFCCVSLKTWYRSWMAAEREEFTLFPPIYWMVTRTPVFLPSFKCTSCMKAILTTCKLWEKLMVSFYAFF